MYEGLERGLWEGKEGRRVEPCTCSRECGSSHARTSECGVRASGAFSVRDEWSQGRQGAVARRGMARVGPMGCSRYIRGWVIVTVTAPIAS